MQFFKKYLLICIGALLYCVHLTADELPSRSVESTSSDLIRDLENKLIKAIVKSDANAVKDLIAAGANVNAKVEGDAEGIYYGDAYNTILMLAAKRGNVDIVKALIAAGADVNGVYSNIMGMTPLMVASQQGHSDIVIILIAAGANVEATNMFGATALIEAAKGRNDKLDRDSTINAIVALIAAGANVNATDSFGGTALIEAAKVNSAKTIKVLIAAGADLNARDDTGRTALEWVETCDFGQASYDVLTNALKEIH